MKKIFIACLSLFVLSSCEQSSDVINDNSVSSPSTLRTLAAQETILWEEAPDLGDINSSGKFSFTLAEDTQRDVILDVTNSVIHVPYRTANDLSSSYYVSAFPIKIAKKNVKPDSGCDSCVDCIGFRCKRNKPNVFTVVSESEATSKISNRNSEPISSDREIYCVVIINKDSKTVDYYPLANLDWNNLAANE